MLCLGQGGGIVSTMGNLCIAAVLICYVLAVGGLFVWKMSSLGEKWREERIQRDYASEDKEQYDENADDCVGLFSSYSAWHLASDAASGIKNRGKDQRFDGTVHSD